MKQKLTRADKSHIAYIHVKGNKNLCVLYLHGLLSSQESKRADIIRACAKGLGAHYVSLDYTGHGDSSGQPSDFRIGRCLQDTLDVIGHTARGMPLLVVGHSLGGLIAFLLAERRPRQVLGVLGIAAGIDCMDYIWKRWIPWYGKVALLCGKVLGPNAMTKGYCFSYPMFLDAARYRLLNKRVAYDGDVVLMCGDKDNIISWQHVLKLKDTLTSPHIKFCLIKGGSHRLNTPENLNALKQALIAMHRRITK